jgi:chemotaxis protein MotB
MRPDSVLQVVGMADRAPLDTKNPRAPANRRIELMILSTRQAHNLAAMFGMPGEVAPLIEGVDTTAPKGETQNLLRPVAASAKDKHAQLPAGSEH